MPTGCMTISNIGLSAVGREDKYSHVVDPSFLHRKLKLSGKHQTFQLSFHATYFTVFLVRMLTGNTFRIFLN